MSTPGRLAETARLFLRLGCTAFGGPAAHIALMEDEVVRRRAWVTREEFLDLLGAANLIPGPNSTELAIHLGHRRAGWPGLAVAGACFILPASIITAALAWAYVRFGNLPQAQSVMAFVKPVVIAVVLQALWKLGSSAVKNAWLAALGSLATVACFMGVDELAILLAAGLTAMGLRRAESRATRSVWPFLPSSVLAAAAGVAPFSLTSLFLAFAKIGSVLFGSGYVLLAFLRADLVQHRHWLTEPQLLDAVAVGQITPGPVFTTATFIGYLLGGVSGAMAATAGIFLPAFFFVAISGPLVPRLRRSPSAGAFLDGVNFASLALMVAVTWELGRTALVDPTTILIAIVSALLLRFRVSANRLILGSAVAGLALSVAGLGIK